MFGLSAGISPGPLLTLVFSETIKNGQNAGIKVAIAPLITDIFLVSACLFLINGLSSFNIILGLISFVGALFLLYLAFENFRITKTYFSVKHSSSNPLKKAILANILNPQPYIFWLTVGSSFMLKGGVREKLYFLLGFYCLLISSKILVAIISEKGKAFLEHKYYIYLIRLMGLFLLFFAYILVKDGLKYF